MTRSAAEPRLSRAPATFHGDRCRRRQLSRATAGYLGAGSGPGPLGPAASRIHVFAGLSLSVAWPESQGIPAGPSPTSPWPPARRNSSALSASATTSPACPPSPSSAPRSPLGSGLVIRTAHGRCVSPAWCTGTAWSTGSRVPVTCAPALAARGRSPPNWHGSGCGRCGPRWSSCRPATTTSGSRCNSSGSGSRRRSR